MNKLRKDPFTELSEIQAKQVKWLWKPFIPLAMISILEGDPGLGKSFLAMHIAAQVTLGGKLPGGQQLSPGNVVYLSAEDDNAFTIRPRMEAMGADLERVLVLDEYMALNSEGIEALTKEVESSSPRLIIIDPLMGFMESGPDPYKPTVIRPFLAELRRIGEDAEASILIIRHLAKARHGNPLYQGAGSIDQIGVARSAMRVAEHPDDSSLRVLAHLKHNLTAPGPSLLFSVDGKGTKPRVTWHGETDLKTSDLDGGGEREDASAIEDARAFLEERLKADAVPVSKLLRLAEARGISKRTLERAKEGLRVKSRKRGKEWTWSLPT